MARDWIKMRVDLWDHPKVVRILSAICPQSVRDMSMKCRVIGALYRTWAIADTHTSDGILDGYDADALDAAIGIEGWAENMQRVGWLIVEPQRLIVPRFKDHNGESAKKRAEDSARKRNVRKTSAICPQNVRDSTDKKRTREEKRREDIDTTSVVSCARTQNGRFVAPTFAEVAAYCVERGNSVDPQKFIDHYTSNGWRVGRNSMKDWRASVRTWERGEFASAASPSSRPKLPDLTEDDLK